MEPNSHVYRTNRQPKIKNGIPKFSQPEQKQSLMKKFNKNLKPVKGKPQDSLKESRSATFIMEKLQQKTKKINNKNNVKNTNMKMAKVPTQSVRPKKRPLPSLSHNQMATILEHPTGNTKLNADKDEPHLLKKKKPNTTINTTVNNTKNKPDTDKAAVGEPMIVKNQATAVKEKPQEKLKKIKKENHPSIGDPKDNFPLLKNTELIHRFMSVKMTNNQKGRIRQQLKDTLDGTDKTILPYIINNMIESIVKGGNLTAPSLRKIRILYNMLKEAVKEMSAARHVTTAALPAPRAPARTQGEAVEHVAPKNSQVMAMGDATVQMKPTQQKDAPQEAKKGAKRYIVFVGNLPLNVSTNAIIEHFSILKSYIKSVRIPHVKENAQSCNAYVEFTSQPSFEFALSKHHSMFGNRRINVLYATPKESKITKPEAKAKRAKLVAMGKAGKLPGSIPLAKKRSQRRLKKKNAAKLAKAAA